MSTQKMKPIVSLLAAGLVLAGCSAGTPAAPPATSGTTAAPPAVLEVGIAQIVDHPALNDLRDGFKEGMDQGGYDATRVRYEDRNASGDQATLANISASFATKDVVVAIATPTAQAMAQAIPDRPIFFAGVTDPVGADLVASLEQPGGNLTGTSDFPPVEEQLALVKQIAPDASRVGFVYSSAETNSHSVAQMLKEAAPGLGLEIKEATVSNSSEVGQAAESLAGEVDAFFVSNDNTVVSAIESVVQVSEAAKKPLIVSDSGSVERGALASFAVDYRAQGVQTGRMAARMLEEGKKPAEVPVERASDFVLTVNPGAAQRMGTTIPQGVLARADTTVQS